MGKNAATCDDNGAKRSHDHDLQMRGPIRTFHRMVHGRMVPSASYHSRPSRWGGSLRPTNRYEISGKKRFSLGLERARQRLTPRFVPEATNIRGLFCGSEIQITAWRFG